MMKSILLTTFAFMIVVGLAATGWTAPSDIVWTDDVANNPVIVEPGITSSNRAYYGHVIYDPHANKWRAWFDASSGADIGYGESDGPGGINFGNYALCAGFSTGRQSKAFVVQLGPGSFRMWYTADERGGGYIINTCVSTDGVNWTDDVDCIGIAEDDPTIYGPTERIAVVKLDDGSFVAYVRCEEPNYYDDYEPQLIDNPLDIVGNKFLHRYVSTDGRNWTWTNYTLANNSMLEDESFMTGIEFSSVVPHPDKENVWYAWGSNANSEHPVISYVSTDGGITFTLDEPIVAEIGEIGTQTYNQNRNFHPSVTYMGGGQWIMYRSVADPKGTARAVGVEETGVNGWELH